MQDSQASSFLRDLSAEIQKPSYKYHVMPFVLLATSSPDEIPDSQDSTFLGAGALDTMRSPLCPEAMNQLMGHIKETTKPSAHSLGADMARGLVDSMAKRSRPRPATHRPDELLSAQRKSAVEEAVAMWKFPAHTFDMDELTYGALSMLEHVLQNPELESYRLPRAELMTFLLAVRRQYKHEREGTFVLIASLTSRTDSSSSLSQLATRRRCDTIALLLFVRHSFVPPFINDTNKETSRSQSSRASALSHRCAHPSGVGHWS